MRTFGKQPNSWALALWRTTRESQALEDAMFTPTMDCGAPGNSGLRKSRSVARVLLVLGVRRPAAACCAAEDWPEVRHGPPPGGGLLATASVGIRTVVDLFHGASLGFASTRSAAARVSASGVQRARWAFA